MPTKITHANELDGPRDPGPPARWTITPDIQDGTHGAELALTQNNLYVDLCLPDPGVGAQSRLSCAQDGRVFGPEEHATRLGPSAARELGKALIDAAILAEEGRRR